MTTAPPLTEAVDAALARALAHLASRSGGDGLWRDFRTLAGASSDWVSGYVCDALSEVRAAEPLAGRAARRLVARQRGNGGWGYNRRVPTDADSTAWVLVALSSAAPWRPSAVLRGTRFLARHQDAGGGLRTYDRDDGIHRFIAAPPEAVPGWAQPHICVTAAGLLALASHRYPDQDALARAASYVRETRNDDGCWSGYWWTGIAYPTAMALRALVAARAAPPALLRGVGDALRDRAGRGRAWADDPGIGPSAFATALALRSLMLCGRGERDEAVHDAVGHLLDTQRPDGAWAGEPILRIPRPGDLEPGPEALWRTDAPGTGVVVSDVNQVFGTATAIAALARYQELHRRR
ncbi:prenyltransferase/squalene oxidase repeat-containing protein [Streptomyces sp. NRRL S-920]|uniref:prenyltransferase/squalene oxidase repeat-containing protein n=1 Tax=Streptomyces sp. NRRL S-920 TaxID=1463921 RepID=UPI0004C4F453|nr:prenyltransferase/squalene oxidase repeat-containing protein [Streptomyces sp. NRRL S-920]